MSDLLVKICGLTRLADAEAAAELGADMLGFIFHPPSKRNVAVEVPARLDAVRALKVGVFVSQTPDEIMAILDDGFLDLAQLHGDQPEHVCEAVGPDRVIKVLWPERYENADAFQADLDRFAPLARWFLFDAGTKGGGHGRTINTALLKQVESPLPWLLAGGLGPHNIAEALKMEPDGIDMSSGVEAEPGIKDLDKLARVFELARG